MNEKDYLIGIDLGTNSVGYAVLGLDYKVIKTHGKRFWGSILFDEGQPALGTRTHRSSRRMTERRADRIRLLRELMANSINTIDDSFFRRLDDAFLWSVKDLQEKYGGDSEHYEKFLSFSRDNIYNLFDGEYTDVDYYKEFPTIYHLRKRLCTDKSKADIRLIYLALHHIIKYRGNFLHDGDGDNFSASGIDLGAELFDILSAFAEELSNEDGEGPFSPDEQICKYFADTLKDSKKRNKEKKEEFVKKFEEFAHKETKNFCKKFSTAAINLLLGYTATVNDLAINIETADKIKLSFSSADYDEKRQTLPDIFGDTICNLIDRLYAIYSDLSLSAILGCDKDGNPHEYIYEGMIARYEKNKEDLRKLKGVFAYYKQNDIETYRKFFNGNPSEKDKEISFVSYFKPNNIGKKYNRKIKMCNREDFYNKIKKMIESIPDKEFKEVRAEDIQYIYASIENGDFLIKLNSTKNAAIPYQLNLKELREIIKNQGEYYSELKENAKKIESLLTFRRPYSVGVIKSGGRFSWVKLAEDQTGVSPVPAERVYPWNFEELVNYDSLSKAFITRMTGHCQIYKDEYTLPKMSVTYQIFSVLNELANIKVITQNGKERPLTTEEKQSAFALFLDKSTVTTKDVMQCLNPKFNSNIVDITGMTNKDSKKFESKMSAYRQIRNAFHGQKDCFKWQDNNIIGYDKAIYNEYDKICEILTVFNDNKIRRRQIKAQIKDIDEVALNNLIKLNFKDWGKFSRKCLLEIKGKDGRNVIETLYNTSGKNFESLKWEKEEELGFKSQFEEELARHVKKTGKIQYKKDIDEMYLSPSVKRAVWQAIKATEEIVEVMGHNPKGIYIESTRKEDAKKQTKTRRAKLEELYRNTAAETAEYNDEMKALERVKGELAHTEDSRLDDEMVYLYMLQLGKCMYSGKTLNLATLSTTCEIDHIVPQHYIKDDSLQNKVLVLKGENQAKSGQLVLNKTVRDKMCRFWEFLKKHYYIGNKKYYNLLRDSFKEEDFNGFINRQLTETSQEIKAVRDLLKSFYSDSDIEFVKGSISSAFRCQLYSEGNDDFFKLRDLNDYHHAKDAYLAAAVGYFTRKIYPMWGANNENRWIKEELQRGNKVSTYELCNRRNGIVVDAMMTLNRSASEIDDGIDLDWNARYVNILSAFANNDCLISRKKDSFESAFYNATIRSPKEKKGNVPLRYYVGRDGTKGELPIELYGNYEGENPAYCVFASYQNGKRQECELTRIPARISAMANGDKKKIEEYLSKECEKADNGKGKRKFIAYDDNRHILKYQLIRYKGQLCYLTSDKEIINAEQLVIDKKLSLLLYCIAHPNKKVYYKDMEYRLSSPTAIAEDYFNKMIEQFIVAYTEKLKERYPVYSEEFANKITNFANSDEFKALPLYKEKEPCKAAYITNLLSLTRACSTQLDMGKYGATKGWGRLAGKTIRPNEVVLIDTSVTGIYRSESKEK